MGLKFAARLHDVGEYWFSRKLDVVRQMRAQGRDVINLGIGSPDLPPPAEAVEAAAARLRDPAVHGYASYRGTPELRRAMADWYRRTYGVAPDAEAQVLPLLGSKEGVLYLSMALLDPGDAVLVPDPGYPAYAAVAKLLGARVIRYDLRAPDWLPDLDALERQDLTGCKLMWVNYPHMPTGARGTADLFAALAGFATRRNILICNDNPYGLVLNRDAPRSLMAAPGAFAACAELNSLSKSFNLAGWRVGLLVASREVVDAALQVKSNVDSGMFLAVQAGATAALAAPQGWHDARNAAYAARRAEVWRLFDALGCDYDRAQVGLFVWARAPEGIADVTGWLDELLARAEVFLVPGQVFGENGRRYVRASLCAPVERLREAAGRVEAFVKAS